MKVFAWNTWFETGIEHIDAQHQKLVEMINTLGTCEIESQDDQINLQNLYTTLFDYAHQHFADEEKLMAEFAVDSGHTIKHRKEHAEFAREVTLMAKTHSENPRADFEMLYRYLISWLGFHILGTDHAMTRQVMRIRSGMSPEDALRQELNSQDHGLSAMQDALFNLYEVVTEQNKQLHQQNSALETQVNERMQALEVANAYLLKNQQELQVLNQQLKLAQNQVLQSEKMAAIGQLAAGVAHEINNPIGFVSSNLGTLKTYTERLLMVLNAYTQMEPLIPPGEELASLRAIKQTVELDFLQQDVVDLLQESREGLDRVTKIIQDLKDFSHVNEAEWIDTDLNQGLDSTLNVVWNEVKYKAKIIKEYGDIPEINCLASQINQVFLNLIVNASHAIEESGTITLRTQLKDGFIVVEVADSGMGIPPEIRHRIFEPFFTTKPIGKGTGLGLSLSYDIVKKHGGHIDVSSEPGVGTSFKVWLPLHREGVLA